jgi:hypothetical protein
MYENRLSRRKFLTVTLIGAGEQTGLKVNAEKTEYNMSGHQNIGQNHDVKTAYRSFRKVPQLIHEYLGATVAN